MAQVRLIFSFRDEATRERVFGAQANKAPTHFAYVEWFSRFRENPEPWHGLHRVKRMIINNSRVEDTRAAAIVPVERIQRSVSLIPRFGRVLDPAWNADNVLEVCPEFYVNSFSDKHAYITMP